MGDRGGLVGDRPPFPEMTRGLRQVETIFFLSGSCIKRLAQVLTNNHAKLPNFFQHILAFQHILNIFGQNVLNRKIKKPASRKKL